MLITTDELDIERYERDRIRPATLLPRLEGERWAVREQPIDTDLSPRYLWAMEGEMVRVPLFPYLVNGMEPPRAVALAARLGAGVMEEFYDWFGRTQSVQIEPARLHITLGHPVQEASSGLRFWIGFALLVKERQRGL